MKVPEQFTHVPNEYKAPWYHQVEGEPTRYINPRYRSYVQRRDAKLPRRVERPKSQVLTKVCIVCESKFPTTSPCEPTCGDKACRQSASESGYVTVYPVCVMCKRAFDGSPGDRTCSMVCARHHRQETRVARDRYRTLRPASAGWDWEDHKLMEALWRDPEISVERYACVVCDRFTYSDPRSGRAYSCSPEHEFERRMQKRSEALEEGSI